MSFKKMNVYKMRFLLKRYGFRYERKKYFFKNFELIFMDVTSFYSYISSLILKNEFFSCYSFNNNFSLFSNVFFDKKYEK